MTTCCQSKEDEELKNKTKQTTKCYESWFLNIQKIL
jgi:hypothetical protein